MPELNGLAFTNTCRDLPSPQINSAAALQLNDKEKQENHSGISTHSVTGASFGYAPLWTALFSFPLIAAVQMVRPLLGMVTGRGLASNLRRN